MHMLSMPRLGQTMDAGVVVRLGVDAGASFETGDLLYVVETEKVEIDVEAKSSGQLVRWVVDEGAEVPVGGPLAVIVDATEEAPTVDVVDAFVSSLASDGDAGAGPNEVVAPDTERRAARPPGRPRAMPRTRVLARERGVDLAVVVASGSDGVISVADVERHIDAISTASGVEPAFAAPTVPDVEPLTGHRRAMFASMTKSWSTIPHFVESICIDATNLLERRRSHADPKPTITAYLIDALAAACSEFPILHAEVVSGGVRYREQVSVAIATDTEVGLVAPVLTGADLLDVGQIHQRLQDLAARARSRSLTIDEVTGAGVTVSSLGAHGVEVGTPIIPPGQTSMLFAGAIKERPVVVDGDVVARSTMWLTLACDHRLVDGATAARALDVVRATLGDPRE